MGSMILPQHVKMCNMTSSVIIVTPIILRTGVTFVALFILGMILKTLIRQKKFKYHGKMKFCPIRSKKW